MNSPEGWTEDRATICCCIERGRLEAQTLLMLEGLRRNGGPLGASRVLAIVPRRGVKPSASTVSGLRSLGVELHEGSHLNRMTWYNLYNKIVAVQVAEEIATTPVIIWLDSDVIIADTLHELGVANDCDFAARREWLVPAVFVGDDASTHYWKRASEIVGVNWEKFPRLPADGPDRPQWLLFNSGVYAYRRGLGFVETYGEITRKLMKARLALPDGNFWLNEQNSLTLAVVKLGLRYSELPRSEHHMVFQGFIDGPGAAPPVDSARLIHYSGSMYPEHWPRFMARLRRERPALHEWLYPKGPIDQVKVPRTPGMLARKISRNLRYRLFSKRCDRVQ